MRAEFIALRQKKKKLIGVFLLDSSKHTIILLKLMQIFLSDCEAKRDIWIEKEIWLV